MNKIHVEYSQAVFISCVTFLIHGQAGRSTVWANGTQNLGLVNFVPESRLPFVQISSIYHKTTAKALTRYQRWLWRNGSRISVWIFRPEKQDNLFRCSVAPGNFLMERLKKSSLRGRRSRAQIPPSPSPFNYKKFVCHLLSNRIFRKNLVNGKQSHTLVQTRPSANCRMCHANIKLEGAVQKLGRYFFCFCSL